MLLVIIQISGYTLGYVGFDVVVIERVIRVMAAVRAKEIGGDFGGLSFIFLTLGMGYHYAAVREHLRVCAQVLNYQLTFIVGPERPQVLTGGRISAIQLPVERIDADGSRLQHAGICIHLHIPGSFGVPAHDDAGITFTCCEFEVRVGGKIITGNGIAL